MKMLDYGSSYKVVAVLTVQDFWVNKQKSKVLLCTFLVIILSYSVSESYERSIENEENEQEI